MGFQRDNIPLAEFRDSVPDGVWGRAPQDSVKGRKRIKSFNFIKIKPKPIPRCPNN